MFTIIIVYVLSLCDYQTVLKKVCAGGQSFIFHHGGVGEGGQKSKIGIVGGQKKYAKFVKIPPPPRMINNNRSFGCPTRFSAAHEKCFKP